MRIRTVLCTTLLATIAAFPLAGVASAQPQPTDRDCRDFASQAAAQTALRSRSSDPERLDPDHDGIACEDHFRTGQNGPLPAEPVVDTAPEPDVVVPPPGAPADAPVRTVPEHQILVKPRGAADAGDGSASESDPAPAVLLVGGLGAVVALGARRRAARR